MSVTSALASGRRAAEAMFQDTFTAYSPGIGGKDADGLDVAGSGFTNQGTTPGKVSGPSVQARDTDSQTVTVGGVEREVIRGGIHIPVSAPVPVAGEYGKGWEYVLTELGPMTDPSLLNSRWLVVDVPAKSYATARRLDVVRIA